MHKLSRSRTSGDSTIDCGVPSNQIETKNRNFPALTKTGTPPLLELSGGQGCVCLLHLPRRSSSSSGSDHPRTRAPSSPVSTAPTQPRSAHPSPAPPPSERTIPPQSPRHRCCRLLRSAGGEKTQRKVKDRGQPWCLRRVVQSSGWLICRRNSAYERNGTPNVTPLSDEASRRTRPESIKGAKAHTCLHNNEAQNKANVTRAYSPNTDPAVKQNTYRNHEAQDPTSPTHAKWTPALQTNDTAAVPTVNPPLWFDGDLNSDDERWDDIPPEAAEAVGRRSNSFACEELVSRAAAAAALLLPPPPPLALEPGVGDAEDGGGGGWSSGDARPPPPPPAPAGPALATGLNCSTLFSFTLPSKRRKN